MDLKAMRVPAADVGHAKQFIWHGVAYVKVANVKGGIMAGRLDNAKANAVFIGATALVKL